MFVCYYIPVKIHIGWFIVQTKFEVNQTVSCCEVFISGSGGNFTRFCLAPVCWWAVILIKIVVDL